MYLTWVENGGRTGIIFTALFAVEKNLATIMRPSAEGRGSDRDPSWCPQSELSGRGVGSSSALQ